MSTSLAGRDQRGEKRVPLSELHMPYYVRSSPLDMEGVRFTPSPDYSGKYAIRPRKNLKVVLSPCNLRRLQ